MKPYLFLGIGLMEVASYRIVGDVEGMVPRRYIRVVTTLDNERVLLASDHVDFGNQ